MTQKSTPNQSSRNGYKPCLIVWHIADGTYNGTVAWEMNRDSQVSSHFVLGQGGEITQLVPLERAAWTQGVVNNPTHPYVKAHSGVNPNQYCISIECEGVWSETKGALTDKQLAAAAELTRYIVAEVKRIYKVDIPIDREHMIGHCEINPVTRPHCPGEAFPYASFRICCGLQSGVISSCRRESMRTGGEIIAMRWPAFSRGRSGRPGRAACL